MDIKTGDKITLTIEKISSDGSGIARNSEGFVFFVPFVLPGETVEVEIVRLKKSYGLTRLISVIEQSPMRVDPLCKWFGKCGGCQLQHCSYDYQLQIKTDLVRDALNKIGHVTPETAVPDCFPSPMAWRYRNKASFPVRKMGKATIPGFFAKGTHTVVPVDNCMINDSDIDKLYAFVSRYFPSLDLHGYVERSHAGMVRHIIIRKGIRSSDLLFSIVLKKRPNRKQLKNIRNLAKNLKEYTPGLVGFTCNINSSRGNVILGQEDILIEGRDWIEEDISGLSFRYNSTAFFQVNTPQAENLFSYACNEAMVNGSAAVLELYSGVGVLTSMLAKRARTVVAVEDWPSSVDSMKDNFARNLITNVKTIRGRVEQIIEVLSESEHDVVVLDPPRSGCAEEVIDFLKAEKFPKIVYISCNPATLARDLSRLCSKGDYVLEKAKPFDMFPQTNHVETVATLRTNSQ